MSENGASQRRVLRLDPRDNALVALTDLRKGETINFAGSDYVLLADVPAKHKFVTADLPAGGDVIMYGVLVGRTSEPLQRGGLLSTRNLRHAAAPFHDRDAAPRWSPPDASRWRERTFLGYQRADGLVGTRNYWVVLPLVSCENRNLAVLKQAFEEELGFAAPQIYRRQVAEMVRLYREGKSQDLRSVSFTENKPPEVAARVFRNVDGIKFLIHEGGCGGTREDSANLCALLAGYIHHPNVSGATVLSLGCQHSQVAILLEQIKKRDPKFSKPLLLFEQQQSGSELRMIAEAIRK